MSRVVRWRALLVGLATIFESAAAGAQPAPPLADTLRRDVPRMLAEYHVPGAAIVILKRGAAPQSLAFGVRDAATGAPVDGRTVFLVGSISKLVTAVGALRLVDEGAIGFDAPVSGYLRRWTLPPAAYALDRVTARTLLSHTAGLSVRGYFPGSRYPGPVPDILDSMSGKLGAAQAVRVVAPPGLAFSYSGGGYSVLQVALEDRTGTAFQPLMQRLVFDPLKLGRTSFAYDAILQDDVARPHDLAGHAMPPRVLPNLAAAGLSTTADDLAAILVAAFDPAQGRAGLLSPAASALLATPMAPPDVSLGRPSVTQTMLAPETLPDPSAIRYGPGAAVTIRGDGRRIVGHSGSNAGWKANAQYVAKTGDGIVVLTNGENGNGVILGAICEWRRALDAASGAATPRCPRYAAGYIGAAFTRDGEAGALRALRQVAAAREDWYFSDHTADDVAGTLQTFAGLAVAPQADVRRAGAALIAANAELFPASAFAQARLAVELARGGRKVEAASALARAQGLGGKDGEVAQLIDTAGSLLATQAGRQEGNP
ncbi:MAG: class A beta-lactamase-related serine hydrolase [Phenylobacterium sp.]|uniref:serine hydrolase domain-containing protein n=1 Tax=Phenylobacterium sp. TaxID=1871053 RepID=UPI001220265E|nr:serine hydrolase domain-containing protein [Phenylobacterium sp.]TAJ68856.1 MAG: class A beta-lactamase-related serine hydrolase [Phenylobacterium sp.]